MAIFAAGAAIVSGGLNLLGAREQSDAIAEAGEGTLFNPRFIESSNSPFANVSSLGPGNQNITFGTGLPSLASSNPTTFDFASLLGGSPVADNRSPQVPVSAPLAPGIQPGALGAAGLGTIAPDGTIGTGGGQSVASGGIGAGRSQATPASVANSIGIDNSLGNLTGAFDGLTALATQGIGQAGLAGITPDIQQAFNNQQAAFGAQVNGDFGTLDALAQGTGQQFGFANQAATDLSLNGFQRGLQDAAFAGANSLIDNAATSSQDASAEALQLLRDQARLSEDRQFQDLQENLFATGRLGTSGGALQTEAFARGLAEADNDRQILALQEGRNAGTFDLNQAAGLAGVGSDQAALEDQLLNSAFNRFSTTTANGINLSDTAVALSLIHI